jgi:hypothetical protein
MNSKHVYKFVRFHLTCFFYSKIDMSLNFGSMTRVEKLMSSLQKHLFMNPENNQRFLEQSRRMIQDVYINNNGTLFESNNAQKDQLTQDSNQNNMENTVASLAI